MHTAPARVDGKRLQIVVDGFWRGDGTDELTPARPDVRRCSFYLLKTLVLPSAADFAAIKLRLKADVNLLLGVVYGSHGARGYRFF